MAETLCQPAGLPRSLPNGDVAEGMWRGAGWTPRRQLWIAGGSGLFTEVSQLGSSAEVGNERIMAVSTRREGGTGQFLSDEVLHWLIVLQPELDWGAPVLGFQHRSHLSLSFPFLSIEPYDGKGGRCGSAVVE